MLNRGKIILPLLVGVVAGLTACNKEELTNPGASVPAAVEDAPKAASPGLNQLVAQVRQATAAYHNHQNALNDGFTNTEDCVAIPGVGGMGVHFVRFDRLDGIHDPLEPEVLVYELRNNGTYKLVAFEYLYVGETAPMFGDEIEFHPFPEPFADYALHVWAWKVNPNGMFEDWNPDVSCP